MANDIVWDDEKPDAGIVWDDAPKKSSVPANHGVSSLDTGTWGRVGKVLKKALPQEAIDMMVGATSLPRNVMNFVKSGSGDQALPSAPAEDSGWKIAGEMLDPFALATGVKGAQLLGKVPGFAKAGYEAVRGKGLLEGSKAVGRNMATGATVGGGLAGVQGQDMGTGAAFGAAVPLGMGAAGGGRNFVAEATGPLRESWRTAQMAKMLRGTMGDDAVQRAEQAIAGDTAGGTVGDILARTGDTGAAPLAAIEAAVSKDPRLAGTAKQLQQATQASREADIGRFAGTPERIEAAKAGRTAMTDPMRSGALEAANVPGQAPKYLQPALAETGLVALKPEMVTNKLDKIRVAPGNKTNPTVQAAMDDIEGLLAGAVKRNGTVDSRELYTLRKQAGNVINKYAAENKDWDKRFTSGLLMDVQKQIDDAVEGSIGNTGQWNRYLDVYSKRSKGINQMELGQQLLDALRSPTGQATPGQFARKARTLEGELDTTLAPMQRSAVERVGQSIDTEAAKKALASNVDTSQFMSSNRTGELRVPHLLSRTATVTNAALNLLGQGADAKVIKDMGNLMLTSPKEFSKKYLAGVPPEQASAITKALREGGNLRYPIGSAVSAEEQ